MALVRLLVILLLSVGLDAVPLVAESMEVYEETEEALHRARRRVDLRRVRQAALVPVRPAVGAQARAHHAMAARHARRPAAAAAERPRKVPATVADSSSAPEDH